MKTPIKDVSLSFSCPEKYENMVDVGNNKYCGTCKHLVVDFTKLSQSEFDEAVKNAPGRLCGRFKSSQMSSGFLKYAAASVMSAAFLAPTSCASEDPLPGNEQSPEAVEQTTEEHEFGFVGIVFIPDT